jgi:acetyl esterase
MFIQTQLGLCVEDVQIVGHAQTITLRSYRPGVKHSTVPVILYFHGGAFTSGTLDDGDIVASFIAKATPAWVISVGYSLAPQFPFPHATEDGYRALLWAVSQAGAQRADPRRVGLAGHDAGGNIATCVAAIARDRSEVLIGAQVLIAPLLDPSMTRLADEADAHAAFDLSACARCYADYLPSPMLRLHPYAAPIESRRLWGLPPALICSVQSDRLHVEAERYASALIAAGVPTEVTRYRNTSRQNAAHNDATLLDMVAFFCKRLAGGRRHRNYAERVGDELDRSENT